MTAQRRHVLIGTAAGLVWGVALVWIGTVYVNLPIFSYTWILALSFLPPGLVLSALIGRMAHRRFLDDDLIEGLEAGAGAKTDQRVLAGTIEQLVLALALWPVTGHILAVDGPGVVIMLGFGFALARITYWVGCHLSPLLRAFGFAATFFPTLIALLWAALWWVVG